jgi:hypothetical protein
MMTRLYQAALAGIALSVVCAGVTGADQVIDRGYDHAIALASQSPALEPSGVLTGVRLVSRNVTTRTTDPNLHTAATEHAWLTSIPVHSMPVHSMPVSALNTPVADAVGPATSIATVVGARFTLAQAGQTQTLEVVEVREIAGEFVGDYLTRTAVVPVAKLLLVSCKIITDATAAAARPRLVRFLVDAEDAPMTRL